MNDNKTIAEFMGCTFELKTLYRKDEPIRIELVYGLLDFVPEWRRRMGTAISGAEWCAVDRMEFHKSWDWLMPVIIKIANEQSISGTIDWLEDKFQVGVYSIDDAYWLVVEYIKWINRETKNGR